MHILLFSQLDSNFCVTDDREKNSNGTNVLEDEYVNTSIQAISIFEVPYLGVYLRYCMLYHHKFSKYFKKKSRQNTTFSPPTNFHSADVDGVKHL